MTSLLRELVPVPNVEADSTTRTSLPFKASSLATAIPTTPAPITTQSTTSVGVFCNWVLRLLHCKCLGLGLMEFFKSLKEDFHIFTVLEFGIVWICAVSTYSYRPTPSNIIIVNDMIWFIHPQ